jgi:hypothetical protein
MLSLIGEEGVNTVPSFNENGHTAAPLKMVVEFKAFFEYGFQATVVILPFLRIKAGSCNVVVGHDRVVIAMTSAKETESFGPERAG